MSEALRRFSDIGLRSIANQGGRIEEGGDGLIRLLIPGGSSGAYRLAQIDNYYGLSRSKFPYKPPFEFSLRARASCVDIPGTWGFGMWNDPLGIALPGGVGGLKLPVFPNTAWFFHASAHSHLALRDDIPGNGWFAGVYRSPGMESLRLLPWMIFSPLIFLPSMAKFLRRKAGTVIPHEAVKILTDPVEWHHYSLDLAEEHARFCVDGVEIFATNIVPTNRLGLVIWIDNQFMAYPPDTPPRWGTLASDRENWIEVKDLSLDSR